MPTGAVFVDSGNGSGSFDWTPDHTQSGTYTVTFYATDDSAAVDSEIVTIDVIESGNQPPSFTTVLPDTIEVFATILHDTDVVAIDPDLDSIILNADTSAFPPVSNVSFVDHGDGTGTFTYTPKVTDIDSVYQVIFTAADYPEGAADTIITHYRVNSFMRGDVDNNGKYTMNDIVYLINYLFRGGATPVPLEAGDVDASGAINVSDVTYLINYLYHSGPPPPQ